MAAMMAPLSEHAHRVPPPACPDLPRGPAQGFPPDGGGRPWASGRATDGHPPRTSIVVRPPGSAGRRQRSWPRGEAPGTARGGAMPTAGEDIIGIRAASVARWFEEHVEGARCPLAFELIA